VHPPPCKGGWAKCYLWNWLTHPWPGCQPRCRLQGVRSPCRDSPGDQCHKLVPQVWEVRTSTLLESSTNNGSSSSQGNSANSFPKHFRQKMDSIGTGISSSVMHATGTPLAECLLAAIPVVPAMATSPTHSQSQPGAVLASTFGSRTCVCTPTPSSLFIRFLPRPCPLSLGASVQCKTLFVFIPRPTCSFWIKLHFGDVGVHLGGFRFAHAPRCQSTRPCVLGLCESAAQALGICTQRPALVDQLFFPS
jgi:hypothetical protein